MIADAGGVPVAGGGRVREGLVFRVSGALAGRDELAELESLGLRRLVDLRARDEDRAPVEEWAAAAGVAYVNHPIAAGGHSTQAAAAALRKALDAGAAAEYMVRAYEAIVGDHGPALAATIGILADGLPAGFGCAAGKDRTGIVNALLHVLLGASEEDAADFYAARAPGIDRLRPVAHALLGYGVDEELPAGIDAILGAKRETMLDVFARIRERWGDVPRYLEAHGLSPARTETLRALLVRSTPVHTE